MDRAKQDGRTFPEELDRIGIPYRTVNFWKNGKSSPNAMWLELLYYAGYDVVWILTGENENEPEQNETNMDIPFYNQVDTFTDCTVQILTNTITGESSVGWWENHHN